MIQDVIGHGPDGPRRRPPGRGIVAGVIVVVVAVAGAAVWWFGGDDTGRPSGPPSNRPGTGGPPVPVSAVPPDQAAALVIGRRLVPGSALDQRDRKARSGPWTVLVRRPDGSLGRHGAVVTFPVRAPYAPRRPDGPSASATPSAGPARAY